MPKDILSDVTLTASHGKPVELPQGTSIADVEFAREGQDLTLQLPDGNNITISGYFNHMPDILAGGGARLSPEIVQAFLPPSHPGEYAQAGEAAASDAGAAVGKITEVVGEAFIVRGGEKIVAKVGAEVHQGDVIQTGDKGAVNILFADNTTFAISQNARLSVDQFSYDADSHEGSSFFSMLQGMFVYTSGLIGKEDPASVNINTPVGSIGIRGTVVTGNIMPAGQESTITVVDGAIVITNAGGTLALGDAFDTATLTGYDTTPKDSGTMTSAAFTSTYSALSPVASDIFTGVSNGTYKAPGSNDGTAPDAPVPAPDAPQDGSNTPQPAPVDGAPAGTAPNMPAPNAPAPTGQMPPGPAPIGVAPDGTMIMPPPPGAVPPPPGSAPPPDGTMQQGTMPAPMGTQPLPMGTQPLPMGTQPLPGDGTQPLQPAPQMQSPTAPLTAPLTAPMEGSFSPTAPLPSSGGSTFGGTTGGSTFGGTPGSTFGGTGTTAPAGTTGGTAGGGSTAPGTGGTTMAPPPPPPNPAPPITPEVRFLFSNTYLNNTPGNIADDGIPLLGFGLTGTTLLLGHIDFRGFDPATVDLSITSRNGTVLNLNAVNNTLETPGNSLFYSGTAPSAATTLTAAANPIVYFDLDNNNLYLNISDRFTLINNIQGPFDYRLTVTDQLGHSAVHDFGLIFNSPTPGGPMNILVGDHGVSSNPNLPGAAFPDTMAGTTGNDLYYGRDGNDLMTSGVAGQDVLIGGNGNDQMRVQQGAQARLFGQAGDDILTFDSDTFITDGFSYADGGAGDDHVFLGTVGVGSTGQNFDFTLAAINKQLFNVEQLKLSSPNAGFHTLTLDFQDIFDMTDSNHNLRILNDPAGSNINEVEINLSGWSIPVATPTSYTANTGLHSVTATHNGQTVTLVIDTGIALGTSGINVSIN